MSVMDVRTEWIAYYERHGYFKMGKIEDFPWEADVGQPFFDLNLVVLEKRLDEENRVLAE